MRNLPNILTLLRIVLTFLFVFFMAQTGFLPMLIATVIFLAASFTDFFDGYYAKKHNLVSDFGTIMDPIADKFLILVAFFVFVRMDFVEVWMFGIIVARELLVTCLRIFAISKGKVIAAERVGKYKTVSQITVIIVMLIFTVCRESAYFSQWPSTLKASWQLGVDALLYIAVFLTLVSGIVYLWTNKRVLLAIR